MNRDAVTSMRITALISCIKIAIYTITISSFHIKSFLSLTITGIYIISFRRPSTTAIIRNGDFNCSARPGPCIMAHTMAHLAPPMHLYFPLTPIYLSKYLYKITQSILIFVFTSTWHLTPITISLLPLLILLPSPPFPSFFIYLVFYIYICIQFSTSHSIYLQQVSNGLIISSGSLRTSFID